MDDFILVQLKMMIILSVAWLSNIQWNITNNLTELCQASMSSNDSYDEAVAAD